MKTISKKKRLLCVIISVVILFIGVSVITDTPPFVIINGKPYLTYSKELMLNEIDRSGFTNKDVKALKHMKWMEEIVLLGTHITDISFLNEMDNIKEIRLYCDLEYQIDDWEPLSNCRRIERFLGVNLNIVDLSVFKELTSLKDLELTFGNKVYNLSNINDISEIKYLVNLERFQIVGKEITDISALKDLKKLIEFSIYNSSIDDISVLSELPNLEILILDANKYLIDVSSLKNINKLRSLSLRGTGITDYSVVLELPNLQWLHVDEGVLTEKEIRTLKAKGVEVIEKSSDEE